jgi:hypothetical protein
MNTSLVNQQPNEQWEEADWVSYREQISNLLKEKTCVVTFTKKDGETRVMTCTLQPDLLPKQEIKESAVKREPNLNNLSVYDLNAEGWRSFIIRNIKQIEVAVE